MSIPFGAPLLRRIGDSPNGSRVNFGPRARTTQSAPPRRTRFSDDAARGPQYGSGAGSVPMDTGYRRRQPRSPSPERDELRPGGPIMRGEWSDQIEWLRRQITTLNSTVADHAHAIAKLLHRAHAPLRGGNRRMAHMNTQKDGGHEERRPRKKGGNGGRARLTCVLM